MKKNGFLFFALLMICLFSAGRSFGADTVHAAGSTEVWWKLSDDKTTLYLRGMEKTDYILMGSEVSPWLEGGLENDTITTVEVETDIRPAALSFKGLSALEDIQGIKRIDTSEMTSMREMFWGCQSLTGVDLSGFNTAKVTDMSKMFQGCVSLETVDLSAFDTAKVEDMSLLFQDCEFLTEVIFGNNFQVENVTTMQGMFSGCTELPILDLSGFIRPDALDDMTGMFYRCETLEKVDFGKFGAVKSTTAMGSMFEGCESLQEADLKSFDTQSVKTMAYLFSDCYALKSIRFGDAFRTDKVADMECMFNDCENLTGIDVSGFNTRNVERMAGMFGSCSGLKQLDLGSFNTEKVEDITGMFSGCSALEKLDIRNFDTGWARYADRFFEGCTSLKRLEIQKTGRDDIRLPQSMQDKTNGKIGKIYAVMPQNGPMTLAIPIEPVPKDNSQNPNNPKKPGPDAEGAIRFTKLMDGTSSNVAGFTFKIFKVNGEDTNITAISDENGGIVFDANDIKNLEEGRYYVQEVPKEGDRQVSYDTTKHYFVIKETEKEILGTQTMINGVKYDTIGIDLNDYNLKIVGFTVYVNDKHTGETKLVLRAYCANFGKDTPLGGEKFGPVYVNPTLEQINLARCEDYTGPHKDNLTEVIQRILVTEEGPDFSRQEKLWELLDHGKEIDLDSLGQAPKDFQFAIITPPKDQYGKSNVQAMIVGLTVARQKVEVVENSTVVSIEKSKQIIIEQPEKKFNNKTQEEFQFIKCDDRGNKVSGAKIMIERYISDEKTEVVGNWISTSNAWSVHLSEGRYRLTEISSPKGYRKIEPLEFSIEKVGESLKFKGPADQYKGTFFVGVDVDSLLKSIASGVGGTVSGDAPAKAVAIVNKKDVFFSWEESITSSMRKAPNTGDDTNIYLWFGIVCLSVVGLRKVFVGSCPKFDERS